MSPCNQMLTSIDKISNRKYIHNLTGVYITEMSKLKHIQHYVTSFELDFRIFECQPFSVSTVRKEFTTNNWFQRKANLNLKVKIHMCSLISNVERRSYMQKRHRLRKFNCTNFGRKFTLYAKLEKLNESKITYSNAKFCDEGRIYGVCETVHSCVIQVAKLVNAEKSAEFNCFLAGN